MPPQETAFGNAEEARGGVSPSVAVTRSTVNTGMKADEDSKTMDFDELLPHVGEFGLYQKILFVLMIPFAFFVAWVYFTQIFITLVPEKYWCWVPELKNLSQEKR